MHAHYNALLTVYSAAGTLVGDARERLLRDMRTHALGWDTHTYTALIVGSPSEERIRLFGRLMGLDLHPTEAAVRCTLKAAASTADGAFAATVARYVWRRRSVVFEAYDYVLLFTAVRQQAETAPGPSAEVMRLLEEAVVARGAGGVPGQSLPGACYLLAMQTLDKAGDWR